MIDLKYHITSLVAVFLALGVGILTGTAVIGSDVYVREQQQIVDRLEKDFEFLREQNRLSRQEVAVFRSTSDNYQKFAQEIIPELIKDRLKGVRVAIIETNSYSDIEDMVGTLKVAGAKVVSTTIMQSSLDFSDKVAAAKIAETLVPVMKVSGNLAARVIPQIASGIYEGKDTEVLELLKENGYIVTEGQYGSPLDALIIAGGSQEENTALFYNLDLPLISYFKDHDINIIGVEPTWAIHSYMRAYQGQHITTVDNIDTMPGQTALVLALEGRPGNYGTKSTAQRLLPLLK
ncbi:MAG: copper transporter [Bacillota bacterium]